MAENQLSQSYAQNQNGNQKAPFKQKENQGQ